MMPLDRVVTEGWAVCTNWAAHLRLRTFSKPKLEQFAARPKADSAAGENVSTSRSNSPTSVMPRGIDSGEPVEVGDVIEQRSRFVDQDAGEIGAPCQSRHSVNGPAQWLSARANRSRLRTSKLRFARGDKRQWSGAWDSNPTR
jgi:hypothetical protein